MMAKAVHSMLRVLDEQRSTAFYKTALGLTPSDRIDFDSFTLIYLRNPETEFELELTVNKDRKEPYNLGDGYGHIAVVVDSLESERNRLEVAGLSPGPVRQLDHKGSRLAKFFFLQDPDGYKIEVIERGGRFR
jgi:lactoylglutathione lyase